MDQASQISAVPVVTPEAEVRRRIDPRTGKVTMIYPESFWHEHEQRRLASGLSIGQYCERHELAKSTYRRWCARMAGRPARGAANGGPDRAARAAGFLPIHATRAQCHSPVGNTGVTEWPATAAQLQIELSGGVTVRLHGEAARLTLEAVLARLRASA